MQKINKYTDDLLIGLELECYSGCFNIEAFRYFEIKIYTLDSNNFVNAFYDMLATPQYYNIIKSGDQVFIKIEQPELEKLENGQLRQIIQYKLIDSSFSDGTYDASDYFRIEGFITDGTEKINIISKGGCC